MHRIDHTTRKIDANGSGKDGFEDRDTSAGLAGTAVTNDWVDDVVENIAQPIRLFGTEPDLTKYDQLASTITVPLQLFETEQVPLANIDKPAFANGHFYVCGSSGGLAVSKVGNVWEQLTMAGSFAGTVHDVSYDPSGDVYVVVGSSGEIQTANSDSEGKLDDSTLAVRTPAGGYSNSFRISFWDEFNDLFIIAGINEEIQTAPSPGTTWTQRQTGGSADYYKGLGHDPVTGNTVIVAHEHATHLVSSSNATTWTTRTLAGAGTYLLRECRWDVTIGKFVLLSKNDFALQTSATGVTWAEEVFDATPPLDFSYFYILPSGRYVYSTASEASPMTWTVALPTTAAEPFDKEVSLVSTNFQSDTITDVIYGNAIFLFAMSSGRMYRSQRGV